jgi:hypothetical protein
LSERELAKKLQEESDLSYFLAAYRRATGENFRDVQPSETPDFLARDSRRRVVGIELTQMKFRPVDMSQRRIVDGQEWADHNDAHWRIMALLHAKEQKLPNWPACARRMLVIQLADIPLAELMPNIMTDKPEPGGFTEIWLADFTMLEMFGGCDLYPIVHRRLDGLFDVASRDRKPYG